MTTRIHHPGLLCLACTALAWGATTQPAPKLDRYGGFKGLSGHNQGRFFRVECINDRFYLVTPDNHAFLSVAVTTALFNDRWGGCCPVLDSCPTPFGNHARYNGDSKAWQAGLKSVLTHWGFNGLGCWCEQGVPQFTENAPCLFVTNQAYTLGVAKIGRDFPDVFDPRFAQAADEQAKSLAPYAKDPHRIGAFPDNEIGWVGADCWGKSNGPTLPDAFIALGPQTPAKQYWAATFLKGKYDSIAKLNQAYGTSFTDFTGDGNSLVNAKELPNRPDHPAIFADKKDFIEAVADRYYGVVAAAMRKHDPNHLVFSARWALWTTAFHKDFPEYQAYNERVWKKAGQYCDIIAINSYMENASLEAEHKLFSRVFAQAQKPFMITEWATMADDTQFERHPEWRRFQRERGEFYFDQLAKLLAFKFPAADGRPVHPCLGAQWFQYYDEPSLGRTDNEKANFGLLNVKDEPYQTALDVMAAFNAQLYDYAIAGQPLRLLDAPVPQSPKGDVSATQAVDISKVPRVPPRPDFQWKPPDHAASFTFLCSPEKCFPADQSIRIDGLKEPRFTPSEPLAAGLWYWCVRAVDDTGLGGKYTDPVPFYVEPPPSAADPAAYLGFEDLSAWRNVSLDDGGGDGVVWAFSDTRRKSAGKTSARVQFTVNSLNKSTGKQNERKGRIAWRYAGPPLELAGARRLSFDLMPQRATDVKGEMTVSSRFLSIRLADAKGNALLDQRIDPEGALAPLKYHRYTYPLPASSDAPIAAIEFYIDLTDSNLPWDQRLYFWIDNLRITTQR